MTTRQRVAAIAAGIALVALAAAGFATGRATSSRPHLTPPPVGPSARKIAAHELRTEAAAVRAHLVLLQWNSEIVDTFGRKVENFTVRFEGTHPAFQVAVVLVRQDWTVLTIRPFN